jgi:hypothetical protein
MNVSVRNHDQLLAETEDLRARLREAEELLSAIQGAASMRC